MSCEKQMCKFLRSIEFIESHSLIISEQMGASVFDLFTY